MTVAPDVVHIVCTDAFAGVERYVTTLAGAQAARGMQVQVLGGAPDRMPAELAGTDVAWAPAATTGVAARALLGMRPGVVHAHMTSAELAAVLAARSPVVATRHFAGRRGSTPAARAVGRLLSRRIAAQVAISSFVAARVEGASTVVHPGVPDADLAADPRPPVVLMAQRLEQEKRADIGLRIWAASGLGDRGWRLRIAGTGACRPDLERLADQLGVTSSCEFLGARDDISDLLATAAVFLAPRSDEPYGLSVVEAMAHATPVVAGSGGGHDETVGSIAGAVLVPTDDPARAGSALAALAGDEARRRSYGRALQDAQRARFGVDAHAAAIATVYAEVVR